MWHLGLECGSEPSMSYEAMIGDGVDCHPLPFKLIQVKTRRKVRLVTSSKPVVVGGFPIPVEVCPRSPPSKPEPTSVGPWKTMAYARELKTLGLPMLFRNRWAHFDCSIARTMN